MGRRWDILLLRHGLTDANSGGVIQGHQPTPLNTVGRAQARRLGERMARHSPIIEVVISSDLPRAAQTAEPIGRACGLPVMLDPSWRERCFGEMEGRSAAESDIWRAASGETDSPGAESAEAFMGRIRSAMERIPRDYPERRTIAVVTHGGPCRAVLRMLIDGRLPMRDDASRPELCMIANCSIMHLAYSDGAWAIERLNDVEHLGEMPTTLRDAG